MQKESMVDASNPLLFCKTVSGAIGEIKVRRILTDEEINTLREDSHSAAKICPDGVIVYDNDTPYFASSTPKETDNPALKKNNS